MDNVEEYLCSVVDFVLKEGVRYALPFYCIPVMTHLLLWPNFPTSLLKLPSPPLTKSLHRCQMSALKEGFSLVMPLAKLRLFYTDELTKLFCGTGIPHSKVSSCLAIQFELQGTGASIPSIFSVPSVFLKF